MAALTPLGPVVARPMFGGHGLWLDDTMFALTFDGGLWLKSDPECRRMFEEGGSSPFVYRRQGKPVEMSFMSVPDAVWAEPPRMIAWAEAALRAALRGKARKRKR